MAHPMKKAAVASINAKMRHMTDGYGAASGPANNIPAEGEADTPSDKVVGFGEGGMAKARADRPSRRGVANPVATYARGGGVKTRKRADGGDVSSIEEANRDQAASNRARGGRAKKHGSTHVNVIVAPQGGGAGGPPAGPMPPMMPPHPMMPPPAAAMPPRPPMMPPGAGGPPGMPIGMPPGAMPPGAGAMPPPGLPVRARGGRVHKDEAQDKALIEKTLKDEGLVRSDKAEPMKGRAKGGRLPHQPHMTAGAVTGIGRLEKIGEKPPALGKPQAV